jgi:hypothetical protein
VGLGEELFCGVSPDEGEDGARHHEADAEAHPEADCSVVKVEAEEVADGETDDPIADDVDEEACVGVACAAERACGGDLKAVEELEDGGDEEQRDGGGDDFAVGGEAAGDGSGKKQEDGGEAGHYGGAEEDCGPAGGSGFLGGFAADALPYPDCCGGGDGEGDHEGEAGAVERDLVSGKWKSAQEADEEGDSGEDGDFDEDLRASGGSEESEAT